MTTFAGVEAQKNHFNSYMQGFEFIEDLAILKPCVNRYNTYIKQINDRSWQY